MTDTQAPAHPLGTLTDLSDDTLLRLMAEHLADRLAYTSELGWHCWDGQRWRRDGKDEARALKVLADWIAPQVRDLILPFAAQGLSRPLVQLLRVTRQEVLLRGLRGHLQIEAAAWDAHPHLLNTPAGVVDLTDGTIRPHDPDLLQTRQTRVGYRPGATHPDWSRALECLPDPGVAAWVQAVLGSGCWGEPRVPFVAFLVGNGANGKSTLLEAATAALGDYAAVVAHGLVSEGAKDNEVMELRGLRLAVLEELPEGHRLNVALMKTYTDTRVLRGRLLYREGVTFTTSHSLVVSSNFDPVVSDTDHGTWRRLRQVFFPVRYGDGGLPADGGLKDRCRTLQAQQEAVLAWLVEGAMATPPLEYADDPEPIVAACARWRDSSDVLGPFLEDTVVPNPAGFLPRDGLFGAFTEYLATQGQRPWAMRTFLTRLESHPTWLRWAPREGRKGPKGGTRHRGWHGVSATAP